MKQLFIVIAASIGVCNSQVLDLMFAKEYVKEMAEIQAKEYLIKEVLGLAEQPLQFEVDALAAATSLEVISLWYKCEAQGKEGLILGFYGSYVNENGVPFTGYAFKNLPKTQAINFITKIDEVKGNYGKWVMQDDDVRNVYFQFDDMTLMIYTSETEIGTTTIRIFWKGFDATWESTPYLRSKKRLLKNMD